MYQILFMKILYDKFMVFIRSVNSLEFLLSDRLLAVSLIFGIRTLGWVKQRLEELLRD